jgi:hypothetical protein
MYIADLLECETGWYGVMDTSRVEKRICWRMGSHREGAEKRISNSEGKYWGSCKLL